jgi:hypothetical protein
MHLRKIIFASIIIMMVAFGQTNMYSGTIQADAPYQVKYAANLNVADSLFNIANTGARGASPYGPGIDGAVGAICANVYAFSPDEQMIACCSCPVTANGLMSLSAQRDLISNTLTPIVPTSILVKVVATDAKGGKCDNSARLWEYGEQVTGLALWGTTVHLPQGAVTETAFTPATLSPDEATRLRNLCTLMYANGSKYGICKSCQLGALGATKK